MGKIFKPNNDLIFFESDHYDESDVQDYMMSLREKGVKGLRIIPAREAGEIYGWTIRQVKRAQPLKP